MFKSVFRFWVNRYSFGWWLCYNKSLESKAIFPIDLTWFSDREYLIIVVPNTAVSYAKETTMLLSGNISTPEEYCTSTSIRFHLSFNERNHEWLVWMACFFRHSPTHRWSRRSRRKCNPPTMRFSWCLVELELKYTSKAPDTVAYIRRMRPIDFSELWALRMNLSFEGGHTKKETRPCEQGNWVTWMVMDPWNQVSWYYGCRTSILK